VDFNPPMTFSRILFFLTFLVSVTACGRNDITVQRVPKDADVAMAPAGAPAAGARPEWTVPEGWTEAPSSGMRVASFRVATSSEPIDVSVVPLGGDAGGDLANVNRWRGQLGLPPVDEAGLATFARREKLGPHRALVVEFASNDASPKRLLAAIVADGGTTWFFKATGPDADVRRLRPHFLDFVRSVRFHEAR
jgi:hypothetical protein